MESSTVLLKMKVHVVRVTKSGKKLERSGWGTCSGVYIKKNTILTAAHCIDVDAEDGITLKEIWVKSDEGSERAVVIKKDSAADLALLYTPLSGTPVRFAFRAIRGEDCWVIGNPLGLVNIITKGIVSQVNMAQQGEKATFFIVDAVVLPGNSGGAVVDSHGHLIGILTRSTSLFGPLGASGLGIAVDLHTIREFLSNK
jgi:S1-C subfamily serine protease